MNLYSDGGCIGRNPSKIGGTWAWCLVGNGKESKQNYEMWSAPDLSEEKILRCDYGVILPEEAGAKMVTNNVTELLAAVNALTAIGHLWTGTLFTDSYVTLRRLLGGSKFSGVPQWLRMLVLDLRRNRLRQGRLDRMWGVSLVAGHPTKKELATGKRERNGLPVSKWNVWCDKRCREEARRSLDSERRNG